MAGDSARELARRQRDKSARLARSAERYERGAEGEAATAVALSQLEANGWAVFHDVRWPGRPRANIDHVAVGPAGVFVIDSKLWSGDIRVVDGVLWQGQRRREHSVAAAGKAALAVTGLLQGFPAVPVLCFVRSGQLAGWAHEVMVCSTENIADWLLSLPPVLGPDSMARTVRILAGGLAPALAPPAHVPNAPAWAHRSATGRVPAPRNPGGRAGSRRRGSRSSEQLALAKGFVIAVVMAILAVTLLPKIAAHAPQMLGLSPVRADLGSSVALKGTTTRPALRLTAAAPVAVPAARAKGKLPRGAHLVAVRLDLSNESARQWTSPRLRVAVRDSTGTMLTPVAVRRLGRGPLLPKVARLHAGGSVGGYVAFALPRRTQVAELSVAVGPSAYETVRWRAHR